MRGAGLAFQGLALVVEDALQLHNTVNEAKAHRGRFAILASLAVVVEHTKDVQDIGRAALRRMIVRDIILGYRQ